MVNGYCVKCKMKNQLITGATKVKMKNGRFAMKGHHAKCGSGMYRIM
jgi:hypothetical protein